MEKGAIIEGLAREYAGVTVTEERSYDIPEEKMKKMTDKITEIENIKNLKFAGMRRGEDIIWDTVKKIMEESETDLIFIDNLDLITSDEREEDMAKQKRVMRNLMSFTSEKNIPIVLIHHYRKGVKGSQGMDELAGSGKIADSADILINLSRRSLEESITDDVGFPESNKTVIWVQKSRGYKEKMENIYFVEGTFYDYGNIPKDAYHRGEIKLMLAKSEAKLNI
jgi:RecA-family ATPase